MGSAPTPEGVPAEPHVVRVVVHDHRQLVRDGLSEVLAATEGLAVVAAVPTVEELRAVIDQSGADVIITADPDPGIRGDRGPIALVPLEDTATVADVVAAVVVGRRRSISARAHRDPGTTGAGVRLTPREIEVLQLVSGGMSTREVAGHIGISHRTVDNYKQSAFNKLGVNSQAHAVGLALGTGLIRLPAGRDERVDDA
jgi:DNA-binding NarL/FixJ family response regulator